MGITTPAGQAERDEPGGVFRTELAADLTSAQQARSAVRQALAAWGMDDLSGDVELLASELVANAAEHTCTPIGLALRHHPGPTGERGITCEVTDTSPSPPRPRQAKPDDERGRGLAIVTALATGSGVRTEPTGKTSWFTLALRDRQEATTRPGRQAEPEAEAGA
jgi:anti-sigma regulatory factor (Ser/Thr protein kinase)